MTLNAKPNGRSSDPELAELTPDAIRQIGRNVAEHILELGKKARIEAESVEMFAGQVAGAVVEATSQVADRVGRLLDNCEAARVSMEKHRARLSALPEAKAIAPPAAELELNE